MTYICANDIEVSQTHDLSLLCHQCSSIDISFSAFDKECGALKVYATRTRYPNRIEVDDLGAEEALQQALQIYEFVSEKVRLLFNNRE